jgi:anti-anti-sigma factor
MAGIDAESGSRALVERIGDEGGAPVVRITGELDLSNVDEMRRVLDPLVAEVPERLIFELNELQFMDSSAITVFLQVAARVKRIELRNAGGTVRRIVEATGLTDILHLDP